jgi:hypothetical protein
MLAASLTRPLDPSRDQYLWSSYRDASNYTGVYWKANGGLYAITVASGQTETKLLANDVATNRVHRVELLDDGKVYLNGTLVATLTRARTYGPTLYLGRGQANGSEWTGGCGFFELSPTLKQAVTAVDATNVREDLLTYSSALSRATGTPTERVFAKTLEVGSLGLVSAQAEVEPNLDAPFELWVDEVKLPYAITRWSFTPNEDVVVDDVGYGPVRVAWPELQASGVLSFVLEDVPAADIPALRSLFLKPKTKRWLAFRGRRYQADEFEFSERPDRTRFGELYTVSVTTHVYRPYIGLPSVPGTRIWPILSTRRMQGSVYARILEVFIVYPKMFVVHSEGVYAQDLETGAWDFTPASLSFGLDAMYWYTESDGTRWYAIAVADSGANPIVFFLRGDKFTSRVLRPPVTATKGRFYGKKLLLESSGNVYALDIGESSLTLHQSGARLNLSGTPMLLSSTAKDNAVYPVPNNVLWAVPADDRRMLVASTSAIAIYEVTRENQGYRLSNLVRTLVTDNIERAGYFGKPGFLEGYWYTRAPQTRSLRWYPVGSVPSWSNYRTDADGDGWTDAQEVLRYGHIFHQSAAYPVYWSNLRGFASDGFAYFPYTDKLVFRVEILL